MRASVIEILALVFALVTLALTSASLGLPRWLGSYGLFKYCPFAALEKILEGSSFKNTWKDFKVEYGFDRSNTCRFYNDSTRILVRVPGFLMIAAIIANLLTLITIILFVVKFQNKCMKIFAMLFSLIGMAALAAFAIWLALWLPHDVNIKHFGPGVWLALASSILTIVTGALCNKFKTEG